MKLIAQNFLGLQRVEWEPDGVCLVVGPNGSGKTSLLQAFAFLRNAFIHSVPKAVEFLGGARGLKRHGVEANEPVSLALEVEDLKWELELGVDGGAVAEFPGERLYVGGEVVLRRTSLSSEWSLGTERIADRLEDLPSTCLLAAWERRARPAGWRPLINALLNMRVYNQKWSVPRLWDASLPSTSEVFLNFNVGRNLFSVLRNWRAEPRRYRGQYEWVRDKARLAFYDIFDDLEIRTQDDERVGVQYFPPGSDEGLPVRRAADGLIVGLLHLTAIAGAPPGALVTLDEMENQLHPHAIRVILAAMRELAEERDLTVVLTTHSPVLMNEFQGDLERFFVTEPGRDRLPVRLDELHDPRYLAQFALGDLFERLKIGAPAPVQDSAAELADVRVALIPTGIMELLGLRDCLAGLFPGHRFEAVPSVPERPGVKAEPFSQSFTARHRVDDPDVPTTLAKLIQELAGQVYPRRRDAADVAVVVDDLELFNLDQTEAFVAAVHRAAREHLERAPLAPRDKAELARELRERASFHLAVPMTEAWFFADAGNVARNGVPAERLPKLLPSVDPEAFETTDLAYSADDGAACATIAERNRRRRESRRAPWLLAPQPEVPWFVRERHPKAYLQWLCRDPADNWCTSWRESKAGAEALRALDWNAVLANPSHCAYARALVDDLADALGESRPFADGGVLAPLTARKPGRQAAVLRNL